MALISLQNVSVSFGGPLLLEDVNLQIEAGEWVGLLGRNGMGKSTLLKLVNGDILPQSGTVTRQQNLRVALLPQEVPLGLTGTVSEIVTAGLIQALDNSAGALEDLWQQQLQVEQYLPVKPPVEVHKMDKTKVLSDYIFEPDKETIVRELIPQLKEAGAEGIIEYPLNKVVY